MLQLQLVPASTRIRNSDKFYVMLFSLHTHTFYLCKLSGYGYIYNCVYSILKYVPDLGKVPFWLVFDKSQTLHCRFDVWKNFSGWFLGPYISSLLSLPQSRHLWCQVWCDLWPCIFVSSMNWNAVGGRICGSHFCTNFTVHGESTNLKTTIRATLLPLNPISKLLL